MDNPQSAICNPQSGRIRLVHCIGSMRVGGAECQLMELIERLPRDRFEQSLVLLRAEGALMDRVRASGCEVVDLGLRRRASRFDLAWPFSFVRMFFRYVGFLRRRRPDILHAQLSISNILSVAAGRLAGVPRILTAQLQLCNYKRNKPLLKWIENFTNRRASAVVVNSDAIRRDMMECDGLEPERFRRVYNGVVLENFKPLDPAPLRRELGLAPDDIVLVVVANLHPYKGHDDLLRALACLLPRYPKLRLLLPGRDQGMGARLRALAAELNLESAVQFLGERRDVPALLAASDIAIHPSHEEGFSNSILEAMTAGLPLVVTAVGGNVEQVIDGENGFLVPLRDPESLAAALEKLLADPALRRRMGAASRQRIEREFSIERNVENYIKLYESLADPQNKFLGPRTSSSATPSPSSSQPYASLDSSPSANAPAPLDIGHLTLDNPQSAIQVRRPSEPSRPQSHPIRLVHCIGTMNVGGAEGQLAELICRLPRDRFQQSLVLLFGGGPLLEKVRAAGCEVLVLNAVHKFGLFSIGWYWVMGSAFVRYFWFLIRRRPHILHAQLFWANVMSVAVGRLAGVPRIVTARRQLSDYKQGRPRMQMIENWTNRHASAVIVNSEAVRADVLAHERIDSSLIHRIYNGVVLERFAAHDPAALRRELGLAPGHVVITVVANLHRYKGHEDLLRAVASLAPRYPQVRLLFPGRDQGMGTHLRTLARELGLEPVVQFLGERRDVPALLAASDIAVHPSHEEGFSNSILEAMTAGLPLVVTRVGGNVEQVIENENGFLFPPRDAAALAAALEKLLADPALRRRMGEASRRRIETEFSIERTVAGTIAFYERLLNHPDAKER